MAAVEVHKFAQCITCHAWSRDRSSNVLILFSSSVWSLRKYGIPNRKTHTKFFVYLQWYLLVLLCVSLFGKIGKLIAWSQYICWTNMKNLGWIFWFHFYLHFLGKQTGGLGLIIVLLSFYVSASAIYLLVVEKCEVKKDSGNQLEKIENFDLGSDKV